MALTMNILSERIGLPISCPAGRSLSTRYERIAFVNEDSYQDCVAASLLSALDSAGAASNKGILFCGTPEKISLLLQGCPSAAVLSLIGVDTREGMANCFVDSRSHVLDSDEFTYAELATKVTNIFSCYQTWELAMKDVLIGHGTYQDLFDVSEPFFKDFISLNDSAYRLIAHLGTVPVHDPLVVYLMEHGFHSKETIDLFKKYRTLNKWETQKSVIRVEDTHIAADPTLSYVVRMKGNYYVHLVLHCAEGITEGLVDRFKILSDFVSMRAQHAWHSAHEFDSGSSLVLLELLQHTVPRRDRLEKLLVQEKIPLHGKYLMASLRVPVESQGKSDSANDLLGYYAWRAHESIDSCWVAVVGDTVAILLGVGSGRKKSEQQIMEGLAQFARSCDAEIGVSDLFEDVTDAAFAYDQACLALTYAHRAPRSCFVDCLGSREIDAVRFSVFFPDFALDADGRDDDLLRYCLEHGAVSRLRELDARNGTNDLEILFWYMALERKKKATSDQLHIHLNTLKYRLTKIESALGVDLEDASVRMRILFEYHLTRAGK